MASSVACRILSRSISSTLAQAIDQASACSRDQRLQALAACGTEFLGVTDADDRVRWIEDDRRRAHWTGERAAPGFVDASDQIHAGQCFTRFVVVKNAEYADNRLRLNVE
jgi:hypothetical protein